MYLAELEYLSDAQRVFARKFLDLLETENKTQNLTRIVGEEGFVEGHLTDVYELHKSGFLGNSGRHLDLGSGCGVPGLLYAGLFGGDWMLAESEKRKADFLENTARVLKLSSVQVFSGRGEKLLKTTEIDSVVARALGKFSAILALLKGCSTWNNLILLKGPRWEEEFEEARKIKALAVDKSLVISGLRRYETPAGKKRIIVQISRLVPRGTSA